MKIELFLKVGLVSVSWTCLALCTSGCETDSFFDQARVGRWEPTPIKLPILKRLDLLEEEDADPPNLTQVMPEDLIAEPKDYVIGFGDVITISIFELLAPGVETPITSRVNSLGQFRHPRLGAINVIGFTASELEDQMAQDLKEKGILKDPMVTVFIQQGRQNSFSFTDAVGGTFQLFKHDLRLYEATAFIGTLPGNIRTLYVIRKAEVQPPMATRMDSHETAINPAEMIIEILENPNGGESEVPEVPSPSEPAPRALERSLDDATTNENWIYVDGSWVQIESTVDVRPADWPQTTADDPIEDDETEAVPSPVMQQRVIEIPFDKLRKGDLKYNIVIRPGDIIRVPSPSAGRVHLMGSVNRPGTYVVPGDNSLTFKQLVASAGGFSAPGMPEKVDIIRRIDLDQEATMRFNARAIFHGHQPDFFIKPDDIINVGTNMGNMPLAIIRRGFRVSYGFGFILDRNFGIDVFPGSRGR